MSVSESEMTSKKRVYESNEANQCAIKVSRLEMEQIRLEWKRTKHCYNLYEWYLKFTY